MSDETERLIDAFGSGLNVNWPDRLTRAYPAYQALLAHIRAKDESIAEIARERDVNIAALESIKIALRRDGTESYATWAAHCRDALDRVAALEAEVERLRSVTVGAIPEVGYYADGWNDCRQAMFAARKGEP